MAEIAIICSYSYFASVENISVCLWGEVLGKDFSNMFKNNEFKLFIHFHITFVHLALCAHFCNTAKRTVLCNKTSFFVVLSVGCATISMDIYNYVSHFPT